MAQVSYFHSYMTRSLAKGPYVAEILLKKIAGKKPQGTGPIKTWARRSQISPEMVGFSFGGLVAGLWAQAWTARVARLVLVGSPGLSDALLPPLDLRRWDALPAGDARTAVHRHNLLQLMLNAMPLPSKPAIATIHNLC